MAFTPVQKLSISTGAALTLLALVGLVANLSTAQLIGAERAVVTTNANIARIDHVLSRTLDAENAQRMYVNTGSRGLLPAIDSAQSDVEFALDSLRVATEDNPEQRRHLDSLGPVLGARFRDIRKSILIRDKQGREKATKFLERERSMRSREGAAPLIARMRDEEARILGERTRFMSTRGETVRTLIIGGSVLAFLFAFIALQPLRPAVADKLARRLSTAIAPVDADDVPDDLAQS